METDRIIWRPSRRQLLRGLRWTAVAGASLTAVSALGVATALRIDYAGDPEAAGRTRGHDAVWLGHSWVDDRRTPAALAQLVRRVRGTGIRDLYVHAGPLEHDGSLDPALRPGAAGLLADLHRALPGVRVQA